MAEYVTLGLFLAALGICIITEIEVLYALIFGVFCFACYSVWYGNSVSATIRMMWAGIVRIKSIIIIFVLIGLLTASWRIGGTIPFIIYHGISLIEPSLFVLCTFLLCCFMSFLTGTSFGTVSTVGVICMLLSNSAGLDPLFTGGAILSGIYFGDRGSPMSASAQLVCMLTQTDIYDNVKNMAKSGLLPFLLTCLFYMVFASTEGPPTTDSPVQSILASSFTLHWLTALPALLILILAALRINARVAMLASIIACSVIALCLQQVQPMQLVTALVFGFRAEHNPELAALLNGGGLLSMAKVAAIVAISSSYSGVFLNTKILDGLKNLIKKLAGYVNHFGATIATATFAAAISCNQTLTVILTDQLCSQLYPDKRKLALALENTTILLPVLIPWNIAGSMPLATIGAPLECIFYAAFIYTVPLCSWFVAFSKNK